METVVDRICDDKSSLSSIRRDHNWHTHWKSANVSSLAARLIQSNGHFHSDLLAITASNTSRSCWMNYLAMSAKRSRARLEGQNDCMHRTEPMMQCERDGLMAANTAVPGEDYDCCWKESVVRDEKGVIGNKMVTQHCHLWTRRWMARRNKNDTKCGRNRRRYRLYDNHNWFRGRSKKNNCNTIRSFEWWGIYPSLSQPSDLFQENRFSRSLCTRSATRFWTGYTLTISSRCEKDPVSLLLCLFLLDIMCACVWK